MKKFLLLLAIFLLLGCEKDLNNTPTKRVEVFLSNYQALSEEVEAKIIADVDEMTDLTEEEKESYIDLWKKHYRALTYEIKDEKVDGDDATVTVEIEVFDYGQVLLNARKALTESPELFQDELGNYSSSMYNDYRLNALKNSREKVKYTIDFKAKKINKKWVLQALDEESNQNISGTFIY